ncbi:MAG: DDE-type integrase/transposase/recombinase [Rectinema sp.]
MGLSMKERQRIIAETATRYREARKKGKGLILDELTALTCYNRLYAMHLLTWWGKTVQRVIGGTRLTIVIGSSRVRKKRTGKKKYSDALYESLKRIWATFDCMCGKRLAVFIRENIAFLALHPEYAITDAVRAELAAISPTTIDRLLAKEKQTPWFLKRHYTASEAANHYKTKIPVRTYYGSDEQRPGYLEIDTVFHSGVTVSGEFCCTLNATDTMTGWVELRSLPNRAQRWVKEALVDIKETLPFRLIAIDSDNGSEFLNKQVYDWCICTQIAFTRSRAYHKNDNPFVEQKNSQYVRKFIGYARYDTTEEFEALREVYQVLCPLLNLFYPSTKLIAKHRENQAVHKTYDTPQTPFSRVLASPFVSLTAKKQLSARKVSYDPVVLCHNLDIALDKLHHAHSNKTLVELLYEKE